jgi:Zn-dependent membrane protease YugP/Flp pilus assembly protein TadD
MVSDGLFDALSIDGWLMPIIILMIVGSVPFFAAMLYVAVRGVRSAYVREGRQFSRCRLTGREMVGRLLEHIGLPSDRIDDGAPIDHYDVRGRRVKLRTESSVSSSVAALAIAAHEVGHAEQFANGYWAARATNCLLVLLVLGAIALFVYPIAAIGVGTGEVNLTRLLALVTIVAVLRLPVTIALELDATRRAKRLLKETGLAHATEEEGITRFLHAAFLAHLAFNSGLVLVIGACVATMWLVESWLDAPALTGVQLAAPGGFQPTGRMPQLDPINLGQLYVYPLAAFAIALSMVWWLFCGRAQKRSVRTAADANNDGMARFQAGDLAGAIALIEEALRLDPGLASAHYNRAIVLTFQGRCEDALASFEAMFACRPEELQPLLAIADPWYFRGILRHERGDHLGAIEDLSRALDLNPSDPAVLLCNRALAWIKLGQLDRALQDTDGALVLAPDDAVAYNNRGVIYRDLGNLEQAESDLRRAIALDPELPNPREHLAKLLEPARPDEVPASSV